MAHENERSLLQANTAAQSFVEEPAYNNLQFEDEVFSGGLNDNFVFTFNSSYPDTERFVLRAPRSEDERQRTVNAINEEFAGMGATEAGVSYRLRSIPEQEEYIYELYLQGFKVLPYLETESDAMLTAFVEGSSLDQYVQSEEFDFEIVGKILHHLTTAHESGVVFGDRWVTNTRILPNNDFMEMDFDLELVGDHEIIAAFELAQTLYHLVHFSNNNRDVMQNSLVNFYRNNPNLLTHYNMSRVTGFLSGHAEFFYEKFKVNNQLYEGLIPPYQEIYQLIEALEDIEEAQLQ